MRIVIDEVDDVTARYDTELYHDFKTFCEYVCLRYVSRDLAAYE